VQKHTLLCCAFLRDARTNRQLLCCVQPGTGECAKVHSSAPKKGKNSGGAAAAAACFTEGHLLLSDYVYHILLFAVHHRAAAQRGGSPFAVLNRLVQAYMDGCDSKAACPLQYVHDFYHQHHAARLTDGKIADQSELQQRWQTARRYIDPSKLPMQLQQWQPLVALMAAPAAAALPQVAHLSETDAVVHQLLAPLNMSAGASAARGKMVVVRVDDNKQGAGFAAGLTRAVRLARTHCGVHDATVTPDFGTFTIKNMAVEHRRCLQSGRACSEHGRACNDWQARTGSSMCNTCAHEHVSATQYEDLLHLPRIDCTLARSARR
jgi:hypothetical protein